MSTSRPWPGRRKEHPPCLLSTNAPEPSARCHSTRQLITNGPAHQAGHCRGQADTEICGLRCGTTSQEPTALTRAVHVPYTVEQDEDGIWCAHAQLRPGVGANGEGDTADAAVADLREALNALIAEFGAPDELTVMIDVA